METPRQYRDRLLGLLQGKDPLNILASTPAVIARRIQRRTKRTLYRKPSPQRWSVAEIVAHLAETEIVMAWRYRLIAEKNGVTLQPFDQDRWADNALYNKTDIQTMLSLFAAVRKANLRFLKGLTPAQWKQYGMHQERGKETIAHIVRLEAGHDINHLRQITAILRGNRSHVLP